MHKWDDMIYMNIQEVVFGLDCSGSGQGLLGALVNVAMGLW